MGHKAVDKYEAYVREGVLQGRRPELVGGGLIRSLGGWARYLGVTTSSVNRLPVSGEVADLGRYIKML